MPCLILTRGPTQAVLTLALTKNSYSSPKIDAEP